MRQLVLLAVAATSYGQWITGYYSAQNGFLPVSKIPWSQYSHIVHFAAAPGVNVDGTGDGTVSLHYLNQAEINELMSTKPSGKKVLVCLKDNDANSKAFAQSTAPAIIATFVTNLASFVNTNRYDGVDIDWEANVVVAQYQDLIARLRVALPDKVITMAAGDWGGLQTVAAGNQADLDQINVMCYDMDNGANCNGQDCTWHNDALFQSGQADKRTCDARVRSFTSRGVNKSKIGIGIPFYARRRTGAMHPQTFGTFPAYTLPYRALMTDPNRWQSAYQQYDATFKADYLSIPSLNEFISYTGPNFISDVVAWQRAQQFGGFMTFTLDYDYVSTADSAYPLSTLLHKAIFGTADTSAPSAPVLSAGSPSGTLPSNTVSTTLSLTTSQNATCAYSTKAGTAYALMPYTFSITGGTSHTVLVSQLQSGSTYTYYVRCSAAGGVNTADYPISFSVAPAPVVAPVPVSVTPSSGSASNQVFHWQISDQNGYEDIQQVDLIIDAAMNQTHSCWMEYWAPTQSLFLKSDDGTTWSQGIIGTLAVLRNKQCSINLNASSAAGTGSTLTLSLALTFTPGYTGSKSLFVFSASTAGVTRGWQTLGSWMVPIAWRLMAR